MTLNSSGVRNIGWVLKISKNTVCSVLKKRSKQTLIFWEKKQWKGLLIWKLRYGLKARWMNFGVLYKTNQISAAWYAIERRSGCILAWHNGKRQDRDFLILWKLLEPFPISLYHTDNWSSYAKYIPPKMHRTGKNRTWKIGGKNLNFRTHIKRLNRKTICFSKNEQIQDNIIGIYMETFYYKTGTYGNNCSTYLWHYRKWNPVPVATPLYGVKR